MLLTLTIRDTSKSYVTFMPGHWFATYSKFEKKSLNEKQTTLDLDPFALYPSHNQTPPTHTHTQC